MVERTLRIEDFLQGSNLESLEADQFLLEEGLELIAAYRSIPDQKIRQSILELVNIIAGSASEGDD